MHAKQEDLSVVAEMPGVFVSRQAQWGGFTSAIESLEAAHDFTKEFADLPTGRCESDHWGYVIQGKMRIKYADREEVIQAGEIYYMAPGHIPVVEEPGVVVEFSPTEEYARTLKAVD
ncbi:MAG TPA: cupin domain-containing protein [Actinomycetota bacterium]